MRTEGRPEGRRIRKRTCFVAATSSYLLTRWWRLLSSGRPSQPRRRRLHPPLCLRRPPLLSPLNFLNGRFLYATDALAVTFGARRCRIVTTPRRNAATVPSFGGAAEALCGGIMVRGVWCDHGTAAQQRDSRFFCDPCDSFGRICSRSV